MTDDEYSDVVLQNIIEAILAAKTRPPEKARAIIALIRHNQKKLDGQRVTSKTDRQ